jgi:hypothetical protein
MTVSFEPSGRNDHFADYIRMFNADLERNVAAIAEAEQVCLFYLKMRQKRPKAGKILPNVVSIVDPPPWSRTSGGFSVCGSP